MILYNVNSYRGDKNIVLASVKNDGIALRHVPSFSADREVVIEAIKKIDEMPQDTFDNIIKKYVEMNVAHLFREGNGRSTRIWFDMILKKEIRKVIGWSKVNKEEYLLTMERSPIKDTEIKILLENALSEKIYDRGIYMKGFDVSYQYEGYNTYNMDELDKN